MYEYALIFGYSIEEALKRVSKWAAHLFTTHTQNPSTSFQQQVQCLYHGSDLG